MRTSPLSRIGCAALLAIAVALSAGCAKEPRAERPQTDEAYLQRMMADIAGGIEALGRELEATAKVLGITGLAGDGARAALVSLCAAHQPFMVDCSTIDTKGIMVTIEPAAYRHLEGSDVSRHAVSIQLEHTKEPALSQVFHTVEKIAAIVFEWPVFSKEGVWIGAVSALIRPELFLEPVIARDTRPPIYTGWVAQLDGKILSSPDPKFTGRNIFTDPSTRHMKGLRELGRRIAAERAGVGNFRRPGAGQGDVVERRCFWDTIELHNAQWRVVLVKKI